MTDASKKTRSLGHVHGLSAGSSASWQMFGMDPSSHLKSARNDTACDMLMYPYTLKQTLAMGLPGRMSPMTYSDRTLSPGVWFVVAVMMLMGSVNANAMAQANRSPHHGSWTSFLRTVQRTSETAADSASSE
nr:unnamed protein product [Digitaria exilis]